MNDVLLVDDERAVLDSLLSALDWAEFGFKQVRLSPTQYRQSLQSKE